MLWAGQSCCTKSRALHLLICRLCIFLSQCLDNAGVCINAIFWMQVQMLFTVPCTHSLQMQHSSDQHLAYVRYYCNNDHVAASNKAKNLNMLHLKRETTKVKQGAHWRVVPSCAVVEVIDIVQKVCISPHFTLWKRSDQDPKNFLLNDVLDLWPNLERIPRDQVQQQQQQQQQNQSDQYAAANSQPAQACKRLRRLGG